MPFKHVSVFDPIIILEYKELLSNMVAFSEAFL